MAFNFKTFWEGLKIFPKTTTSSEDLGDMEVLDSNNKLHFHNGSTNSPVVTEDHAATLENKLIVVADNTITTEASGNLVATELNAALAELDADITTVSTSKVTGPGVSTDNAIARFDGITGKFIQNSDVVISDGDAISRATANADLSISGNGTGFLVVPDGSGLRIPNGYEVHSPGVQNVTSTTGAASNLDLSPDKHYRITDSFITGVSTITTFIGATPTALDGVEITLVNLTGNLLVINNLAGGTNDIKTGTGGAITVPNGYALKLIYTQSESCWVVIGSAFRGPSTSVDNTLPRFDGTTGQLVQGSSVVVSDTDEVSGLTKLNVDNVVIDGNTVSTTSGDLTLDSFTDSIILSASTETTGVTRFAQTVDTATGANATLALVGTRHISLTNVGLVSIDMITSAGGYQEIIVTNNTGNSLVVNNNTGATAAWRIITGTGGPISVKANSSIYLRYDATANLWYVVGSTGGSTTKTLTAGENLTANDYVYVSTGTGNDSGRTAGRVYKVDATNDDRIEAIGFVSSTTTSGNPVQIIIDGVVEAFVGLTPGKMYFASDITPGALTLTPPTTESYWSISAGVALSSTELLINQVASASANYISNTEITFTLANNQVAATNVTGLLVDAVLYRGFVIEYTIYRQTDTALSGVVQIGQLRAAYNSQSTTWFMSDDFSAQNSGITFSIQPSGQVQYTSTNIAGANYVGTLKYSVRKTFNI